MSAMLRSSGHTNVAAGEVNLAHVGVITRSAEQVGCEALRDAEPILLEAARRLDARQLRYVTPSSGTASTRTARILKGCLGQACKLGLTPCLGSALSTAS